MNNLIAAGNNVYNYCDNLAERAVLRGSELYGKYIPSSFLLGKRSVIVLTGLALIAGGIMIIYHCAKRYFRYKSKLIIQDKLLKQRSSNVIIAPKTLKDILDKYHKSEEIDAIICDLTKLIETIDMSKMEGSDALSLNFFKVVELKLDQIPVFDQFIVLSKINEKKPELIKGFVEKFDPSINNEINKYSIEINEFTDKFDYYFNELNILIEGKFKKAVSNFWINFITTFVTPQQRQNAILDIKEAFSENKPFLSWILREFNVRIAIFSLSSFCAQNRNEGDNIIVDLNPEQLNECLKECVELLQMELTEQEKFELNKYFDEITTLINNQTHNVNILNNLVTSFGKLAKILGSLNELEIVMNTDEDDVIAKESQSNEDENLALQLQFNQYEGNFNEI